MGFYVQDEYWDAVYDLPDKEQDAFFGACARQFFRGDTDEPKPKNARRVFKVTRARIDKARKCASSANARWDANEDATHDANVDANEDATLNKRESKSKNLRFTPPTREEASEYLASIGLEADLDKVFDHYESNGWKCGRNPMKDWRAAFRRAAREWAKGGGHDTSEYADAL